MLHPHNITILGVGAFGTALRSVLERGNTTVCAWDIGPGPRVEMDLDVALSTSSRLIIAVGAQHVRSVCLRMCNTSHSPEHIWIASKGIEKETGMVLSDVVASIVPHAVVGVMSGPNIAKEMMDGHGCGMTLACACPAALAMAQSWWRHTPVLIETTPDIVGVQLLGALKNVIAIGYGLLEQTTPSTNMHATYLGLAMAEVARLMKQCGGAPTTQMTYAGWPDLIVSCAKGRNRMFGKTFPCHDTSRPEGVDTTHGLVKKMGNAMADYPILNTICAIVHNTMPIDALLAAMNKA